MWSNIFQFTTICFIGTPGFYVYDSIATLGPYLIDYGYTRVDVSILYSVYYYPNIIFSLLAGLLVDKWGCQKSLLFFSALSAVACFIQIWSLNFWILVIGRVLLGIAAEAIFICQIKLYTLNYSRNLSLVMAMSLVYNRGASWLAYLTLPMIVERYKVKGAFYFCFLLAMVCLLVNIVYFIIKRRDDPEITQTSTLKGLKFCLRQGKFWILLGIAFFYYGAFMSFNSIAPIIIEQTLDVSPEKANRIVSFLTLGAIIGSPLIGYLSDRFKTSTLFIAFGILCGLVPFGLLLLGVAKGMIILFLCLGISYGVVPSLLYRSISLIIEAELTGIATGLVECINAWAVIVYPILYSFLYEKGHVGYAYSLLMILLTLSYILNIILGIWI